MGGRKKQQQRKRKREKSVQKKQQYRPVRQKTTEKHQEQQQQQQPPPLVKQFNNSSNNNSDDDEKKSSTGTEILVVGDGDFSFSVALAKLMDKLHPYKLYATSYDDFKTVTKKYNTAAANIRHLEARGDIVHVRHSVDATRLHQTLPSTWRSQITDVIFNFPHTGAQRVHLNRSLLEQFFQSCALLSSSWLRVHVTLKMQPPYTNWSVRELAKNSNLSCISINPFHATQYPGYVHRTTERDAANPHATKTTAKTFSFQKTAVVVDSSSSSSSSAIK